MPRSTVGLTVSLAADFPVNQQFCELARIITYTISILTFLEPTGPRPGSFAEMRQSPTLQPGSIEHWKWHLGLFNHWRLFNDHQIIPVPLRSQRLAALLALRGRQNRAWLAGTLWPEVDEHRAQASLRKAISVLHRCASGLVEKDRNHLYLSKDVVVDVVEFRRHADHVLAGQLPQHPSGVDHPTVSGGELLPGWYEDWVFADRERVRQLRVHVLETLAHELVARCEYAQALQAALTAVEIDPLRESARRAVINVHIAEGNTADALREYRRFCELLQKELDVGPTHRVRELIESATKRSPV